MQPTSSIFLQFRYTVIQTGNEKIGTPSTKEHYLDEKPLDHAQS